MEKTPTIERFSRILTGLMLAAFGLLTAAGMLMGAVKSRSYIVAFCLGAVCFALALLLWKKWPQSDRVFESRMTPYALALLCLAVNLAWVLLVRVEPAGDYATFAHSAQDLAAGQTPRTARYLAMFPHILGYATFLSLFFRVFGDSWLVAPLVNVGLTVISGCVLYALCLRWRDRRTAACASLLWTFCPSKLLYNTMALSEPFYTCLILLFLLIVTELERGEHKTLSFAGAAAASAVALVCVNAARPIALIPLIAFFIWRFILRSRPWTRPERLNWVVFTMLTVALYGALGGVWDWYAERTLGETPAGLPGYSIYVGFNEESGGSYSNDDMDRLIHYGYDVYGNAQEAQAKMLEEAKARITSGQIHFPRLFLTKVQTFLGNDEGGAYYSMASLSPTQYSVWAVLSNMYYYALVLLTLLGAWTLWRQRAASTVLMVPMYVLGLTLAHMLVEVAGRYHYSVIPMFVICAAHFCGGKVYNSHD